MEITIEDVRQFLNPLQGKEISLRDLRTELRLNPEGKSWANIRKIMERLTEQRIVKPSGRKDGLFKVIHQVSPVSVFGSNNSSGLFDLAFPRDFGTGMELGFAADVIIRAGDLILIAGESNYGKTTIAMNFLGENIDKKPVLMGNEYTTSTGKPTPRFVNRLNAMDWVVWVDDEGHDRFTLLPVISDYAEYILPDRINIVDWINIETGEHYMINNILNELKKASGMGITIAVIQKAEGAVSGRGGQFTKDFADLELLIDRHGDHESRITVGKAKETTKSITGKSWAYGIAQGVKLVDVRQVKKCPQCYGRGYTKMGECDRCRGIKFIDA